MKTNKYKYTKVIQQNYGYGHGWEDVSEYDCNSQGVSIELSDTIRISQKTGRPIYITLLSHDLQEYKLMGYPTRVIFRKTLNDNQSKP